MNANTSNSSPGPAHSRALEAMNRLHVMQCHPRTWSLTLDRSGIGYKYTLIFGGERRAPDHVVVAFNFAFVPAVDKLFQLWLQRYSGPQPDFSTEAIDEAVEKLRDELDAEERRHQAIADIDNCDIQD